ncbi:MAG TPA: NADH-ubiquinone oxidoreductase-F iron-sulfur binding region domain-containing protein [Candidatus Dormibacteraeota bacterium]|nr:NADH-ubiquinone oxidoreductase-F iron-sulfur binding region domain-containing protein [Candidatus Dormibacteraeota bacterium]
MTVVARLQRQELGACRGALGPARLLAGPSGPDPESLAQHCARLGGRIEDAVGRLRPHQLVSKVRAAGLTGRGGGGFPTAEKLASVLAQHRAKVVIGNGSETEPASAKDDLLLRLKPHLVLDGLAVAAAVLRPERTFLVVPSSQAQRSVAQAIRERGAGERRAPRVELALGPPNFVGGEESAVVRWLEGFPALPTFRPPPTFERGWRGKPTLVQSAETLAHLGLIARFGPDWFRSAGTLHEPGTCLVTLSGAVSLPGVYEVPIGLPLATLLTAAGSEPAAAALLVGGYFGSWLQPAQFIDATLSRAGLGGLDATLGAGVIHLLTRATCAVRESQRVVGWLAGQSAGQCGPCARGLPAMAEAMGRLSYPPHATHRDRQLLHRWCSQVENRGACRHPDGVVNLIRSTLAVFADEVELHLQGRCSGSAISNLPLPSPGGDVG